MGSSRRLTDQERRQIVRERAKGVSVSAISAALKVSPKTVYNVLGRGRSAISANDSRTRVLTMRVSSPPSEASPSIIRAKTPMSPHRFQRL
jgi:IS30 family transposase